MIDQTIKVRDAWPCKAPVDDNHVVPPGWDAHLSDGSALARQMINPATGEPKTVIASRIPILLSAWVPNRTTGTKLLEVSWKGLDKWHSTIVDRGDIMDCAKIVRVLGGRGAPVNSGNRRLIVDWLAAYEHYNMRALPSKIVSSQMGWQKGGGFLIGHDSIGCDVRFFPAGDGDIQLAAGLAAGGTMEGWCESIKPIKDYPRVAIALYASLSAPLLKILGASNFIVDWCYKTSVGKTTALRVGASVWGSPDERSTEAFISTWATTRTALEVTAATRTHLPMILDDTKRAESRFQNEIPRMIYDLSQGKGKMRGASGGGSTLETRSFRTVVLTSGESRIVDESKDGGLATRVLSLWGSPFDSEGREVAGVVQGINRGVISHHGHAGRYLVNWLINNKDRLEDLRERYLDRTAELEARLEGSGSASRMSAYVAVLDIVAHLAHDVLPLPWEYEGVVNAMVEEMTSSGTESDRALEALQHVYEWAVSNRDRFYRGNDGGVQHQPTMGWLGRWDKDDTGSAWEYIGITRRELTKELLSAGYDSGIIRLWRDRGWLMCDKDRLTKRVRVCDDNTYLISLARFAIRQFIEGESGTENETENKTEVPF